MQLPDGASEIGALAAKLKAKRALANPEEEQQRLYQEVLFLMAVLQAVLLTVYFRNSNG